MDTPQHRRHFGWYYHHEIPHCDEAELLQSITYRLADSLPRHILKQMLAEIAHLPESEEKKERRKRLERLWDAGHGSCRLQIPEAAKCVVDAWKFHASQRYDLIAWVVMPNHVHLLVRPWDGWPLRKLLQTWKSYTARRLRSIGPQIDPKASIWDEDYWDRYIRDEAHFDAVVTYIHENPVKAGLVSKAEDWEWSSAREWMAGSPNS